jgi:crotonobetaine/carnitine-CoA ligase
MKSTSAERPILPGGDALTGALTLPALVAERARNTPDAPFVIFDDLEGAVSMRTYGEFAGDVNRTAHLLGDLEIRRGDRVMLLLANCPEFLDLWFGAATIGAVIVPVNTASAAEELEYLANHSDSRLIFTQAPYLETAEAVERRCPGVESVIVCGPGAPSPSTSFTGLAATRTDTPPPGPLPGPTDDAAILYTSGTTARPKGVLVTHANYLYAGQTVANAVRLTRDDRHLVVLPFFHGNAQYYSTMSTLVAGASMAMMARFSASRYFDQAIAHRCTASSLFAAPIRMLLAQPRRPELASNPLRVVLFAQSVTPAQLDEWRDRFGPQLLQLWGMTETMGPPIMNPVDGERRNMSMGRTVAGYATDLVDEDGQPVPRGRAGQVVVRGEPGRTLMKGYYKNPEATAATLRDGWLWSGDTARQDPEGYYHFVDRAKDMIKRAGENVAASEVEAAIREHAKVFDCAVIGVPDDIRDESILAVVVPSDDSLREDEIIAWCRRRLARFRVPQRVQFRTALPRTAVGKIQKHVLRAELRETGSDTRPPPGGPPLTESGEGANGP